MTTILIISMFPILNYETIIFFLSVLVIEPGPVHARQVHRAVSPANYFKYLSKICFDIIHSKKIKLSFFPKELI
jgi:hypothetical protein